MYKVGMTAVPMKWKSFKLSKDFRSLAFVKDTAETMSWKCAVHQNAGVIRCATTVILTC